MKIYKCYICNFTSNNKTNYNNHLNTKTHMINDELYKYKTENNHSKINKDIIDINENIIIDDPKNNYFVIKTEITIS